MFPRKLLYFAACILLAALAPSAQARDTTLHLPIKDVLEHPEYKTRLGSDIALYFGKQAAPATQQSFGEVVTNRKTNSFGKPDEEACRWAMLAALLQLVERARQDGGDAVVDITSYYKRQEFVSDSEYECHAGGFIAGLALKGRIVKLKR
jgi:hypothetical protein